MGKQYDSDSRARVLIPHGVDVEVNRVVWRRIDTIRVDGTLSFDATRNTELKVDTLVVSSQGTFQMGTAAEPIAAGVRARLLFTSDGAIDRQVGSVWDQPRSGEPWQGLDSRCGSRAPTRRLPGR